ncbi:ABC transporter substrate-binding protein [Actinophytocola oryzae]|uniref:Carbohydrate ABC transporter substrate-binding protein (CUT1 family) n=1 Tax=Actinophytocola oryzae TaxID=502181 RepID=A0A4R7VXE4_9PSEU|nr:extracellular solute-binding protein [Actinophytocola oryzae]TDV54793.1 carbohydrate ABC transporter substrate-binding protein (CUT1 family) [Actinophytocola oryzae]
MQRTSPSANHHVSRRTVLFAVPAALALSACSGSGGGSTALSNEPVTLRFTWWGSDARHQRTQQVIKLFQAKHKNITVKGEFKEWNGYWDSLATSAAAQEAPDVIQMDELYLASYAERGALLDLSRVRDHLDTSGIDEDILSTGKVEDKQYAIPTGLNAYSMVVNTDILDRFGIDLPDDDTWSWDDLTEIGGKVSAAGGGQITGVQSWGFDMGGLNVWIRQTGGTLFDDRGDVSVKPEVLADYWSYLVELADKHVAPPPSVTVERATASLDQSGTATNTAAFGTWWNTQLVSLVAASGQNLKLLKLPGEADAKKRGTFFKSSMYWSVFSRSKHPGEAALLVDFLTNSREAAEVMLTDRGVPGNKAIREFIQPKLDPADQAAVEYLDDLKASPPPRVTPNGGSNIEKILQRHTEQVLFGQVKPDQAATSFITELQAEIDAAA